MANPEFQNSGIAYDRWLDESLASLRAERAPSFNAGSALTRLRERNRARRLAMRRWTWTSAGLVAAGMVLFLVPASRACAQQPGACLQRAWKTVGTNSGIPEKIAASPAAPAVVLLSQAKPVAKIEARSVAPVSPVVAVGNFKQIGSATAPITMEAYTDYECPWCAVFFRNVMPQIMEQYVRTGKVKFVHRDFPLPQHPYGRLAARFANAAGEIGRYELVANQIFATQEVWSKTGDIDAEVMQVLTPGDMQKVRQLVKNDPRLDDTVATDVAMGTNTDHLASTPTVIVVSGGRREVISNAATLPLSLWKKYLDAELAKAAQ